MLEHIWDMYEDLKEIVYVSDVDTYELIYMNRCAREAFGITDNQQIRGGKCYQILQGCSTPCAICTNSKLKVGHFYEWSYYNPLVSKPFSLKDTLIECQGKRYRIEIAIDMSTQVRQEEMLQEFVNNELLVNEALKIALAQDNAEKSIEVLVEYLGKTLHGERAYIFESLHEGYVCNTYEWCVSNITPEIDNLKCVPMEAVSMWYRDFEKGRNVMVDDMEHLKVSDPLLYDVLAPQGIHTLVVCPLVYNKKIIGFYGVDNPPADMVKNISIMLGVMASFLVSMMNSRNLVHRLEKISYYDQLTGAGNRHKMKQVMADIDPHRSIGVIYADVMELKKTNDTKGHLEGDRLLLESYRLLCESFKDYPIFRVGGDEFVVLCSGIQQQEMLACIDTLYRNMEVSFAKVALGSLWRERCGEDIDGMIIEADQRMYQEKRKYYQMRARAQQEAQQEKNAISPHDWEEYFLQRFNFHAQSYFHALMSKNSNLNIFASDLQNNTHYLSDKLRDMFALGSNFVKDFLQIWVEDLNENEKKIVVQKLEQMMKNHEEFLEISNLTLFPQSRKLAVDFWVYVKWNSENTEPQFCIGGLSERCQS